MKLKKPKNYLFKGFTGNLIKLCQGLDVQQTKYFNRVVDDLCNSGHTLIYVGHFESQLPESLSHKLILEKGEIKNEKFQ